MTSRNTKRPEHCTLHASLDNIITNEQHRTQCYARCIGIKSCDRNMPWSGGAKCNRRTSIIKFAIVKELQQFLIFFHFVLDVQPQGNYSEMFMYNAVRNNKPSFCRNQNVSRTWHSIYKTNEAVLNSSGHSFHAFKIITSNRPTHQVLVMLGNALCETLNEIKQNNNTAHVEEDFFYWLTQSDCVWVEIVGVNKAQEYLLDKLGDTANTPNVYEQKQRTHTQPLPSQYIHL